jgi:hypothetical protein
MRVRLNDVSILLAGARRGRLIDVSISRPALDAGGGLTFRSLGRRSSHVRSIEVSISWPAFDAFG